MREIIILATERREILVDITGPVREVQENWDESVQTDVIMFLRGIIPRGVWLHDAQDGNGDAHLKAGLVGPSETLPLIDGQLGLSTWQNIFLCEFDGPRKERRVIVTVITDS